MEPSLIVYVLPRCQSMLGGRHRRNLLSFHELSTYFVIIIAQFIFFVAHQLLMYRYQDDVSQRAVFLFSTTNDTVWCCLHVLLLPIIILHRSRANYHIIWSSYQAAGYSVVRLKAI